MKPLNWKTTGIGVLTLISTAAYLGKKLLAGIPFTQDDLAMIPPALAGLGLIAAKDFNK